MLWLRTPSATPRCPPVIRSLDLLSSSRGDGCGRAAALPARSLLRSPAGSLAAGEGTGPQGSPSIAEPQLHPGGPQAISTFPSGSVAAKSTVSCQSPGGEEQRGTVGAASPQGPAGSTGSPGHPRGPRAADPSSPSPLRAASWRLMGPTPGQELLPGSSPNLHPRSCGAIRVPWEGVKRVP